MCCVVAAGPRACRDVSTMLYFHIYRIRVFFLLPFAYLHSNVSWGKANQLCVCSRYAANWGWSGEQLKAKARLLRWAAVHSACLNTGRNGLVSWAEKWLCVQNDSALTTPQPRGPLTAKLIHLPAREERQENQWLRTQLCHMIPRKCSFWLLQGRKQKTKNTPYCHNILHVVAYWYLHLLLNN